MCRRDRTGYRCFVEMLTHSWASTSAKNIPVLVRLVDFFFYIRGVGKNIDPNSKNGSKNKARFLLSIWVTSSRNVILEYKFVDPIFFPHRLFEILLGFYPRAI